LCSFTPAYLPVGSKMGTIWFSKYCLLSTGLAAITMVNRNLLAAHTYLYTTRGFL
jgi:hypothetical protein